MLPDPESVRERCHEKPKVGSGLNYLFTSRLLPIKHNGTPGTQVISDRSNWKNIY